MFRYGFLLLVLTTCCRCWQPAKNRQKRVFNGEAYSKGTYPFHISLWFKGDKPDRFDNAISDHFCSGTLVNSRWVITSAFCVSGNEKDTSKWEAYTKLYSQESPDTPTSIEEILIHPDYNEKKMYENNIALLKLAEPVPDFKSKVINKDANCPGFENTLYAIGWGQAKDGIIVSTLPQKSPALTVYDTGDCNTYFNKQDVLTAFAVKGLQVDHFTLCVKSGNGGLIVGHGDAGAPLITTCDGKDVVVGLAIYDYRKCVKDDCPAVFTRVSAFSEWIDKSTSQ